MQNSFFCMVAYEIWITGPLAEFYKVRLSDPPKHREYRERKSGALGRPGDEPDAVLIKFYIYVESTNNLRRNLIESDR